MEEHHEDVHVLCSILLRENTKHELDGKVSRAQTGERTSSTDNSGLQKYRQTTNGHITFAFCDHIYD
jgi:hypothetical protein